MAAAGDGGGDDVGGPFLRVKRRSRTALASDVESPATFHVDVEDLDPLVDIFGPISADLLNVHSFALPFSLLCRGKGKWCGRALAGDVCGPSV